MSATDDRVLETAFLAIQAIEAVRAGALRNFQRDYYDYDEGKDNQDDNARYERKRRAELVLLLLQMKGVGNQQACQDQQQKAYADGQEVRFNDVFEQRHAVLVEVGGRENDDPSRDELNKQDSPLRALFLFQTFQKDEAITVQAEEGHHADHAVPESNIAFRIHSGVL